MLCSGIHSEYYWMVHQKCLSSRCPHSNKCIDVVPLLKSVVLSNFKIQQKTNWKRLKMSVLLKLKLQCGPPSTMNRVRRSRLPNSFHVITVSIEMDNHLAVLYTVRFLISCTSRFLFFMSTFCSWKIVMIGAAQLMVQFCYLA